MMTSIWKMTTRKHIPKRCLTRAGLYLLIFLLVLTITACYSAIHRETPRPISAYDADEVFDKIDIDGNKKIDRQEYMDAVSKSFDKLDKNMNGYLDREEFKATGIPDADDLFDELDTDEDDRISKDEFVNGAEKHFKIMDKRNDYFIDQNELNLYQEDEGEHIEDTPPLIKPFIFFDF
jgi:Ca2+-binding EF-hand superfamily protein